MQEEKKGFLRVTNLCFLEIVLKTRLNVNINGQAYRSLGNILEYINVM